jgi:hypothetical protein
VMSILNVVILRARPDLLYHRASLIVLEQKSAFPRIQRGYRQTMLAAKGVSYYATVLILT